MKKVISAGIKQVLEFDSLCEAACYEDSLRAGTYRVLAKAEQDNGKILMCIVKQYNDAPLIRE